MYPQTMETWRIVNNQQKVRRGKEGFFPKSFRASVGLQKTFWTSSLQNCDRIDFCLWYFVWEPQENNMGTWLPGTSRLCRLALCSPWRYHDAGPMVYVPSSDRRNQSSCESGQVRLIPELTEWWSHDKSSAPLWGRWTPELVNEVENAESEAMVGAVASGFSIIKVAKDPRDKGGWGTCWPVHCWWHISSLCCSWGPPPLGYSLIYTFYSSHPCTFFFPHLVVFCFCYIQKFILFNKLLYSVFTEC